MTEPPDSHDLAKRFLDLWQDQVTAMATDPDLADGLRRWQALWLGQGGLGQGFRPGPYGPGVGPSDRSASDGLQPGYRPGDAQRDNASYDADIRGSGDPLRRRDQKADDGNNEGQRAGGRPTASGQPYGVQTGSETSASVSRHGSDDVAVLLRELRRLEGRIADLERRLDEDGDAGGRTRQPDKPEGAGGSGASDVGSESATRRSRKRKTNPKARSANR